MSSSDSSPARASCTARRYAASSLTEDNTSSSSGFDASPGATAEIRIARRCSSSTASVAPERSSISLLKPSTPSAAAPISMPALFSRVTSASPWLTCAALDSSVRQSWEEADVPPDPCRYIRAPDASNMTAATIATIRNVVDVSAELAIACYLSVSYSAAACRKRLLSIKSNRFMTGQMSSPRWYAPVRKRSQRTTVSGQVSVNS
jgi:hypothetical protein